MATSNRTKPWLLIVDPDAVFQRALGAALRKTNVEPLGLIHPWRTVDVAVEQVPDAVAVDVTVGYDRGHMLEELKGDPRTRHLPLVIYSRKDTHYDRLLAFELGADDYFGRPFTPDLLAMRLAAFIDKRLSAPARAPLETIPDLLEIDRQQVELLRAEEMKREKSGPRASSAPVASRPVLIVEDDPSIRDSLRHILEGEGIPTLTAGNGREALDVMREKQAKPSVVLLDLMMPVMDGWEFRRRVENDVSDSPPKFVVMSALSPDDTIGSAVWLRKPLGVEQLLSTVARLAAS